MSTTIRDYLAEMRDRDRMSAIAAEHEEPFRHRCRICETCARFTGLRGCDRHTLNRLHLRYDDLDAVMSCVGICSGGKDEDDRVPSLVLAEDGTCGECVAYNSIMCDGVPVGHGVCMVDGEGVDADCPQCSNAPASHAQAISDDLGDTNGQDSYNQSAKD